MSTTRTPHMTDYEAERQHFHLDVPEYFNFATDVIGKWASDPHKLAMLWIGKLSELIFCCSTSAANVANSAEYSQIPYERLPRFAASLTNFKAISLLGMTFKSS